LQSAKREVHGAERMEDGGGKELKSDVHKAEFNGTERTDGRKGMNSLEVRDEWMIRMVGWKRIKKAC